MRKLLLVFLLLIFSLLAFGEENKGINITTAVSSSRGTYSVVVKGETLYPDGAILNVGIYQVKRTIQGEMETSEALTETVKVKGGKFSTSFTISPELFLPSKYIVKVNFNLDNQPQNVKTQLPNGATPYASATIYLGNISDVKQILSADRKRMGNVVSRLDALIPVIRRFLETASNVPPTQERQELNNITSLLESGSGFAPFAKQEAEKIIRHLYGLIGGGEGGKGTAKGQGPPKGGGEDDKAGDRVASENPKDPPKGDDHDGKPPLPKKETRLNATTDDIKDTFIRECCFIIVSELERLNSDIATSRTDKGKWGRFYTVYKDSVSVLNSLVSDIRETAGFANTWRAIFGEKDNEMLSSLLKTHRSLVDYYDELIRGGAGEKELKENEELITKEKAYKDALQNVLKKVYKNN